jgi:phage gp29-like protein
MLFGDYLPRTEKQRRFFGRGLDMDRIELAMRHAARGAMVELTDLGREALMLDGHMTGLVQKRFGRCAAIDYTIAANDGIGQNDFDQGKAKAYAEFVSRQIRRIPEFRERLTDLQWGVWDNRALLEIEWEIVSGREVGDSRLMTGWRVKNLHWIHPRRLSYNQNRDLVVVNPQRGAFDFEPMGFVPSTIPEKFIPYTPRLFSDYAEREGLIWRAQYFSYFGRASTRERMSLMELFAAPWRVAYSDSDTPINVDSMKEAFRVLGRMSSRNAAWLPAGVKAQFVQPGNGSGQVHKDIIEDSRNVLSKLILGSTGSTDATPTGLGSSIGDAMLSDQDLIIASDLMRLAEVIENRLSDLIIKLNYGVEALAYAPQFGFDLEVLLNRGQEIANVKLATEAGLRIPLEQAYQRTGFREPRANEPYLEFIVPVSDGTGPAQEGRPQIVWPEGTAPAPGDLAIQPEEALNLDGPAPEPAAPPKPPGTPPAPPVAPGDEEPKPAPEANPQGGEIPVVPSKPPKPPKAPPAPKAPRPPKAPKDKPPKEKGGDKEVPTMSAPMPFSAPSGLTEHEREHHEE